MKGDAASTTTAVTLGDLNVRAHGNDLCHQHAKLLSRRRIKPFTRNTNKSSDTSAAAIAAGSWDHNAASHSDSMDNDDCEYFNDNNALQEQQPPLVQVLVQTLGQEEKAHSGCDIAVRVRLEALIVVCPNPQKSQWLDTMLQGFVQSSTVQYLNAELECLLLTKLHGLRDVLESNLEYLKSLTENKGARVALDLNLRAPLVVVPEDHTVTSSPYLSLDLGRVEVITTALHSNQGGSYKRVENGIENTDKDGGNGYDSEEDKDEEEEENEDDVKEDNAVKIGIGVSGDHSAVLAGPFGHFYDQITVQLADACVELVDAAAVRPFATAEIPNNSSSSYSTESLLVAPWDLNVIVHTVAPMGPQARALPACYVAATAGPLSAQLSNRACTALLRLAAAISAPSTEKSSADGGGNYQKSARQDGNSAGTVYEGAMAGSNDSQGSYSPLPSFDASLPASPPLGAAPAYYEVSTASVIAPSGVAELPLPLSNSGVGEPANLYPAVSTPGRWNRRSGDESDCSDNMSRNGGISSSSSSSGGSTPQHGRLSFVGLASLRTSAVRLASGHSVPTTPVITPSQTPSRKPMQPTPTNLESALQLDLDVAVDEEVKEKETETETQAETMHYGFLRNSMSRRGSSRSLKSFKSFRSFVSAKGSIDGRRSRSHRGMSLKSGSIIDGGGGVGGSSSDDDDDDNESFYSLASGMGFGGADTSEAALDETAILIADYKDAIADLEANRADLASCLQAGVDGSFGVRTVFEAVVAVEAEMNALREDAAAEDVDDNDDDEDVEDHAVVPAASTAGLMNALAEKPALRHALLPSAPPMSPPTPSSSQSIGLLSSEEAQAVQQISSEESQPHAEESLGGWRAVALALPLPQPWVTWLDLARLLSPHAAQSLSAALQECDDELEEFRAVYADMEAALAEAKAFAAGGGGAGTGAAALKSGDGYGLYAKSRLLPSGTTTGTDVAVREVLKLSVALPLVSVNLLDVARPGTNNRTSSGSSSSSSGRNSRYELIFVFRLLYDIIYSCTFCLSSRALIEFVACN